MCQEAKELQEAWTPEQGDRIIEKKEIGKNHVFYISTTYATQPDMIDEAWFLDENNKIVIHDEHETHTYFDWLPYQEQIQELLDKEGKIAVNIGIDLTETWNEGWINYLL